MNKHNKQNIKSTKGFTIIEVVLVLAIAALIFLMVFIALPALQRGQRDAGRKNDVSTVTSALQTYLSNNRGRFGTSLNSATLQKYIDRLSQYDATDVEVPGGGSVVNATTNKIRVYVGQKCPTSLPAPGSDPVTVPNMISGSSRQAAVVTALENNGTEVQAFCQDL